MNPLLTCSQREWLHSSVGGASHRYREVTDSNPVEVLHFFRLLYAIAKIAFTATIISSFSKQTSMRYYPHTVVLETGDLN